MGGGYQGLETLWKELLSCVGDSGGLVRADWGSNLEVDMWRPTRRKRLCVYGCYTETSFRDH